jgi:hypothetical protein
MHRMGLAHENMRCDLVFGAAELAGANRRVFKIDTRKRSRLSGIATMPVLGHCSRILHTIGHRAAC